MPHGVIPDNRSVRIISGFINSKFSSAIRKLDAIDGKIMEKKSHAYKRGEKIETKEINVKGNIHISSLVITPD